MFKLVISVASFCLLCSIVPLYQCLCLMYLSLYCFCSHFLIVNRMCAWLSFHALPHALATHLHPCSSPTPAGLLLVRSSCLVALLLQLSTHIHTSHFSLMRMLNLASNKDLESPAQQLHYMSVSFLSPSLSRPARFLPPELKARRHGSITSLSATLLYQAAAATQTDLITQLCLAPLQQSPKT